MSDERQGQPSASSWARYESCHGSYALEQEARRLNQLAYQGSKDADRGTRIHEYLYIPETILLEPDELVTALSLKERADEQIRRVFDGQTYTELREKRIWLKEPIPGSNRLNVSCRFDLCVYNETTALVINYKSGWREPDPVHLNAQMKVEALLVALNLDAVHKRIERFIVQIVTMQFGVMEAVFSFSELAQMYEDVTNTLRALENPHAELKPSPEACGHCPAVLICQAVKDSLKPVLTILRASPVTSDPKRLAESLDAIKIIEGYIKEFWAFCENGLVADPPTLTINGYAMVPGAENRKFTDIEAARKALLEAGIPVTNLDKLKSHTPAAYQKVYAEHFGRKPEDVKEAFHRLLDGCIEVKQNKSSLKRVKGESRIKELA